VVRRRNGRGRRDHFVVDKFIDLIGADESVPEALRSAGVPRPSVEFVSATWRFVESAPVHCQAAAFAFGREGLIPEMFTQVVAVNRDQGGLGTFGDYLERHIELDGEEHTPMAMQMLVDVCGHDKAKWRECEHAANAALDARARLWDGILAAISADLGSASFLCHAQAIAPSNSVNANMPRYRRDTG
jgi:hypothetical protein